MAAEGESICPPLEDLSITEEPASAAETDRVDTVPSGRKAGAGTPEIEISIGRQSEDGATARPFDVQMAVATRSGRRGQGSQVVGQLLAYAGVLALTVGTCLVIWSHFGEMPSYAPTGWLVATGGQMLLFLGVVTIVTSGLEQANAEIGARVELIGDRLARIEQSLARCPVPLDYSGRETGASPSSKRRAA